MCRTPGFLALIDPSLPEQKRAKPLPNLSLIVHGVFAGANQVPKRLIIRLWYGNRRECEFSRNTDQVSGSLIT